ncbi:hypothetical protein ACH79_10965 [Bradyrhizobium sp. CCBAU 051011]|uniref:MrcB family domain-containing protein n=1 Tax=Bradyrhizobium sp. CCBAU 051011 TaxID=858422 RepID=UPI0013745941|nr:DUF3578 domain-containing protein [Bradyrhizobium sp. CCBAU 051011]QHO73083.1 hypothetical protein ACH79_10965 [Bradyrhizobium sp. CCBAU 051011]
MRDELLEVIKLQQDYSAANTPAMQRRGELIRRVIREQLEDVSEQLRHALGAHGVDLDFEGRDGTGRKTRIPWVRFYSKARSHSAQDGWYCVYLFDAPGTGVYLELGHGSTTLEGGEFRPRPPEELARLVAWGREALKSIISDEPALALPMKLGGRELGDAYERSAVLAKWYPADDMPSDEELLNDAVAFAGYLKLVYDAEVLGLAPTAPPPEVVEVERAASGQSQRRSKAQGFGLNTAERLAVELHAMALAKSHLQELGWRVRDVSATHPYDFECTQGEQQMVVEVKGTTSTGEEVVVTHNEVEVQRMRYPNNALIVVHSVDLLRSADTPKARGGMLLMRSPWEIEDNHLRPIAFRCAVQREELS